MTAIIRNTISARSVTAGLATDELGWAIVRVATGAMLIPHGAQKLFGWFIVVMAVFVLGQELPRAMGYEVDLSIHWPYVFGPVLATILLAIGAMLILPFRILYRKIKLGKAPKARVGRLVVVGFDGMDWAADGQEDRQKTQNKRRHAGSGRGAARYRAIPTFVDSACHHFVLNSASSGSKTSAQTSSVTGPACR